MRTYYHRVINILRLLPTETGAGVRRLSEADVTVTLVAAGSVHTVAVLTQRRVV